MLEISAKEKLSVENIFKKRYKGTNITASRNVDDVKKDILAAISNIQENAAEAIRIKSTKLEDKKATTKAFNELKQIIKK